MNETKVYNIGVIGAGMIARTHMGNLEKTGRAKTTWIAARNPENLEKVRAEFRIVHKTRDYREMLYDPDVDAVIITTPPYAHKEMFLEAVRAGKHVLLEKPMAMNMEEIDEMLEVKAQFPDQVAMECSGRHARLTPRFRKVKEIIDAGVLGKIYAVHHNSIWRQNRPGIEFHPTAKWFLNRKMAGGGPLFDWGVYDLSFHLGVLGDKPELEGVENVSLQYRLDEKDPGTDVYNVEEHFMVCISLTGGITYYWERGAHANMEVPNETRIYGARAGIKLGYCSWDDPVILLYDLDKQGKAREKMIKVDMEGHDDGYALIEHFIDVLEGKEGPVISLEQARKHMEIILRCYGHAQQRE